MLHWDVYNDIYGDMRLSPLNNKCSRWRPRGAQWNIGSVEQEHSKSADCLNQGSSLNPHCLDSWFRVNMVIQITGMGEMWEYILLYFLSPVFVDIYPAVTTIIQTLLNSYSASHNSWCTVTLWNRIMTAQCEGMGEVGSARYEPALLSPCPSIRVLSYSNCQRSTHSSRRAWQCKC